MEDNKNSRRDSDENGIPKKIKPYLKWIIVYATVFLLIILAINFESFEKFVGRIFSVTTPIFFGAVIAYLCNPIYVFFREKIFKKIKSLKWNRIISIILTYLVVFAIIFSLVFVVADQMISSVETFIANLDEYIVSAEKFIIDFINKFGSSNPETNGAPSDGGRNIIDFSFSKQGFIDLIKRFLESSGDVINDIGNNIISSGTETVVFLLNLFFGFIFSIYMLAEKHIIIARSKMFAYAYLKNDKAETLFAFGRYVDGKVGHFIKGKLIESLIVGVTAYLAFLLFKIPAPLMIAVIVAIMNIIPIFGPFLGSVPAALLVLIMDPIKTIPYVIIVVIIMLVNGNLLSPKIVGKRTGLTPLGAIVALTLMSGYFGIIGMFVGIPLCAIIVESLWTQTEKRLEAKKFSTDPDYYDPENPQKGKDENNIDGESGKESEIENEN